MGKGGASRSTALASIMLAVVVVSGCFAAVRELPRVRAEGHDSNGDGTHDVVELILYELHEPPLSPTLVEISRDDVRLEETWSSPDDDPWLIVYMDPQMKSPWWREKTWDVGASRYIDCAHSTHRITVMVHEDLITNSTVSCGLT